MAVIDEVKERIGWLKVLFSFSAATVAALMGWLLIQLQERFQILRLEDVLNLEMLNLLHAGVFIFILASFPVVLALRWYAGRFFGRVIVGIVVVADVALLSWLVLVLEKATETAQLWKALNLWHVGAVVVTTYFLILMLSAMYEISTSIRNLRSLE